MNEAAATQKQTNGLNWPTVVLIIASGGGNWLATQHSGAALGAEQQQAIRQIRELHGAVDDFEGRQKQELDRMNELLRNQDTMLQNQQAILSQLKKP
jgi:hypothetical protein